MHDQYPKAITSLISHLKRLPGVGGRTAERFSFQMLDWNQDELEELSQIICELKNAITYCPECFSMNMECGCLFCNQNSRDQTSLCIVSTAKEVFAIEKTHSFKGLYHVLGGVLSPLDGNTIENLHIEELIKRLQALPIKEVIIALDSTIEGDATSLYLKQKLSDINVKISRLAYGIPIGSPLEFVDGTTLSRALMGRQQA